MSNDPNHQMSLFDLGSSPQPTIPATADPSLSAAGSHLSQPVTKPPTNLGYASLEELEQALQGCQKCPLSQSRTQIVFERGNRQGKIVVIGEAPGQNEDAFCG